MMFLNRSIIFSAIGFTKVFGAADTTQAPITNSDLGDTGTGSEEGSVSGFANFDDAVERGAAHGTPSAMSRIASVTSLDGRAQPKPSYFSQSGMTLSGGCSKRNSQNKMWAVGSIVKVNGTDRVGIIKTFNEQSGFIEITPIEAQPHEPYCEKRFLGLLEGVAKERSLKTIRDLCSIDDSHNDIKTIIGAIAGVQRHQYYGLAKVICDAYTNRFETLNSCPSSVKGVLSDFIDDTVDPLFFKAGDKKLSNAQKKDRKYLIKEFNKHLDVEDKIIKNSWVCCNKGADNKLYKL